MVYIGLRHWVYHWIHRRFERPPEPVGMWSCSPARQQHSHWSHGSSLRMLIFHESECVYHVFTMCLPCKSVSCVLARWTWNLFGLQFFSNQVTIENGCNALARYGKFALKSNQSKHAWNIKHWDCFFHQHGITKLHKWKLTPNNGYFLYIYIYISVWVWVCMGIMVQ